MYPPFRASWQKVIRPSTSFPLPPLKFRTAGFPQYGFKRVVSSDLRRPRNLYAATVSVCSARVLFRSRACARRHSRLQLQPTRPVALGSPSGSIVRSAHCLLRPHLRLCRPPGGLCLIPLGCELPRQPQRVPNLRCQSVHPKPSPKLRWSQRVHSTMPSSPVLPSPNLQRLGNHICPRLRTKWVA